MDGVRRRRAVGLAAALVAAVLLLVGWVSWRGTGGSGADRAPERAPTAGGTAPTAGGTAPTAGGTAPTAGGTAPAGRPAPTAGRTVPGRRWAPSPGAPWQWQLTTPVDLGVDVPVYDIDGFENGPGVVRALHQRGRHVICYVAVGAAEDFRPDHARFPREVLGRPNGWPGERWLDVRRLDVLSPILRTRFDMCRDKGFDAIEPDLLDGYANDTGFPITAADQLAFNRFVARLAHERGLSVGLKNDLDQVPQLVADFDFAVVEECAEHRECGKLAPFVRAGKAVLHVEYALPTSAFCGQASTHGFSSMRKNLSLDAPRTPC